MFTVLPTDEIYWWSTHTHTNKKKLNQIEFNRNKKCCSVVNSVDDQSQTSQPSATVSSITNLSLSLVCWLWWKFDRSILCLEWMPIKTRFNNKLWYARKLYSLEKLTNSFRPSVPSSLSFFFPTDDCHCSVLSRYNNSLLFLCRLRHSLSSYWPNHTVRFSTLKMLACFSAGWAYKSQAPVQRQSVETSCVRAARGMTLATNLL